MVFCDFMHVKHFDLREFSMSLITYKKERRRLFNISDIYLAYNQRILFRMVSIYKNKTFLLQVAALHCAGGNAHVAG